MSDLHIHPAVTLRDEAPDAIPPAPPCAVVIFGAAGDLTKRLVVPALYNLVNEGRLPPDFRVVGVDIAEQTSEGWRAALTETMHAFVRTRGGEFQAGSLNEEQWRWLTERMSYLRGDFSDPATFKALADHLGTVEAPGNRLFYLAVADRFFQTVVEGLGTAGLVEEREGWRRVVVEKPFGHDLASARALNAALLRVLREDQVYRIDHFLGKETVQNIMALRFANGLFEPIWNRLHIDEVQITAAETVGVEARARFYEKTGALRDMVPNHMFQLLAMVAMEPPLSFDADAVRDKKAEALEAIRPLTRAEALDCTVRGQYGAGPLLGEDRPGYREEPDVAHDSGVETYVALRLEIENWRWAGVPFYLRTGKRMERRTTEIAVRFRAAPFALFRSVGAGAPEPNWLVIRVQPDEGISIEFTGKRPGPDMRLAPVRMDFEYKDFFETAPATGYETLLYDCMTGDMTLFQRADGIEAGWAAVQQILGAWEDGPLGNGLPVYAAGSRGPVEADALLARDGNAWRPLAAKS